MTRRRRAREVALQLLFERDHNARPHPPEIARFIRDRLRAADLQEFCRLLYDGVVANAAEIDRRLSQAADNWRLPRMATVDRNALRIGAFELLFTQDIPKSVVLDEAIELARRYGSADSPSFVNGVLDRLLKENEAAVTAASQPPPPPPEAAPASDLPAPSTTELA